ncbi:unnamed protein product [Dracunculus medinensis]|uniref:Innexin n=1 Tax=Dracunculus medinensis TaxID=318479 RepID=A0A0N4U9U2_DRAME|nr:unnamed protein product [Dracunculus medinensis]
MSLLFSVVRSVPFSNKPIAKDVIASLHSYFTCNILIIFAVILSFKHFGGRPIECLLPSGFSGAWEQYAENFCWAENTYFVSPGIFVEQVSVSDRRERRINYYQWMPFFLLFQAACFNASTLIWKYFAGHSGIKMGEILRLACDPLNANLTVKKMNINALNIHLQGALRFQERLKKRKLVPHKIFRFLNLRYSSFYISVVYMTAKCAFLFNACFQLHLLSSYLLSNIRYDFGLNAWCNLLFPSGNESSWNTTGVFPRVALCDFEVREMGNTHTHTVQCVLVVNIFTEKIFILLWTWFVILAIVTVMSIINWAYLLLSSCSKEHFILNHLEMGETKLDKENCETQKSVKKFLNKYLGIDGILVLRMIAAHADIVFSTELIVSLWQSHCHFESFRK